MLIDIKVEIHGIAYDLTHLDNLKWATKRSAVSSQESIVLFFLSPLSVPPCLSQAFFHTSSWNAHKSGIGVLMMC